MSEELKSTPKNCINSALGEQRKQEFNKIIKYVNQAELAYAKDAKHYVEIGLLYCVEGSKNGHDRFRVQTINQATEVMTATADYQDYRYL